MAPSFLTFNTYCILKTFVQDTNAVGETDGTMFTIIQGGLNDNIFTLENTGANTINYHFQQLEGDGTWSDLANISDDSPLNSTLVAGQIKSIVVTGTFTQLRLNASASGSSVLDFTLTRNYTRSSGGAIPLMSL